MAKTGGMLGGNAQIFIQMKTGDLLPGDFIIFDQVGEAGELRVARRPDDPSVTLGGDRPQIVGLWFIPHSTGEAVYPYQVVPGDDLADGDRRAAIGSHPTFLNSP